MKTSLAILTIGCFAIGVGTIIHLNQQKAALPAPVAEPPPTQMEPMSPAIFVPEPKTLPTIPVRTSAPAPAPVVNPAPSDSKPDDTAAAMKQSVDTLVSAQTSFHNKQALLKQLKAAGNLDQVVAELQQRAASNPNDPNILATLGEALLSKYPIPDFGESAKTGMQAIQSFNAALAADPANWEAQYSKASFMSTWPAGMNQGPEVIQQLSSLIDQQEATTPQPEFAGTYLLLGKQYQKTGQSDYAQTIWQLGAQQFPNDQALQQALQNKTTHP